MLNCCVSSGGAPTPLSHCCSLLIDALPLCKRTSIQYSHVYVTLNYPVSVTGKGTSIGQRGSRWKTECEMTNSTIAEYFVMKMLWTLSTQHIQLPSSEMAELLLCVVKELGTLGRPSIVALQPELRKAVTLSPCQGKSVEVSSILLRTNINCLSNA